MLDNLSFSTIYAGPLGGEELRPKKSEEIAHRAFYLVTRLGLESNRILARYLNRVCPDVESISHMDFLFAAKELVMVSTLLLYLRNVGDPTPEWFKQFLFCCEKAADTLYPSPSAREVANRYDWAQANEVEVCALVSSFICLGLGIERTEEALLLLGQLLYDSSAYRSELLSRALTEKIELLDKDIEQIFC